MRILVKTAPLLIAVLLSCVSNSANAWFFFFIPGSVTGKISDAITGSEGDSCVGPNAKVGDVIKSPSGNTATVKSLSGTSSRCKDPHLPIRALLTFEYKFSSKVGIDIPDGYEQKPLSDMQRFQGNLLKAENSSRKTGFFVSSRGRDASVDSKAIAGGIVERMSAALDDVKTQNDEQLTINGLHALRFEVSATSKAVFHPKFTYVITMIDGAQELVVVNAWTKTDDYEANRDGLRELAFRISGIGAPSDAAAPASAPAASAPASAPTGPTVGAAASSPAMDTDAVGKKLRELDKLYKDGILTQQEYDTKKKDLLKAL